jgi:hypothetical protein
VRAHPETVIEYQYACWETGFIGYGTMRIDNVEDEPHHFSYNTPEDLNEAIRSNEGCWKVWTGNPHFEYDENTGLYKFYEHTEEVECGGAAAKGADLCVNSSEE